MVRLSIHNICFPFSSPDLFYHISVISLLFTFQKHPKFQEQFFNQMPFFAGVPICISGTFGVYTAENEHNSTPFFYPTNEFGTCCILSRTESIFRSDQKVPALLVPCRCHSSFHRRAKNAKDSRAYPSPHGLLLLYLLATPDFCAPFFAPLACWCTLTVVLSSISVVSSTRSSAIRADNT